MTVVSIWSRINANDKYTDMIKDAILNVSWRSSRRCGPRVVLLGSGRATSPPDREGLVVTSGASYSQPMGPLAFLILILPNAF